MSLAPILDRARAENQLCTALLELTYACNLDCDFCYNDKAASGRRMGLEDYRTLFSDLAGMGTLGLTLTGGEPLVHPEFFEIGALARDLGFSITIKSNGVTLNERNARRVKDDIDPWMIEMSLHGADAATHDLQTRQPGSFERMLRNISAMQRLGLRMKLNSTLTRLNEDQVEAMFSLADSLNIPLRFDPEVTPRDNGDLSPLLMTASESGRERMFRISAERMLRARPEGNRPLRQSIPVSMPSPAKQQAPKAALKNCGAGSTTVSIDPFGNVYPCVQFRRRVGNVLESDIGEIWTKSPALAEIRSLSCRVRDNAVANGMGNYCMGSAELLSGDALAIHPEMKTNHRLQEQANAAVFGQASHK